MEEPKFFKDVKQLHQWFQKNHSKLQELWIGFYSVKSEKKAATYQEALDEALCFGWIDGIRKNYDGESYKIRFTPRKKKSIWSNVNKQRMEELIKLGRAQPAGLAAYSIRDENKTGVYAFEQKKHELQPAYEKKFKANKKAWKNFKSMAPWYQRTSIHWVSSAKQEATQLRRLETLINDSENNRPIAHLRRDG